MLSLFFIDEVSKYRLYDGAQAAAAAAASTPKLFEEEYVAVAEAFRREIDDPAYRAYLDGIDARETRPGLLLVDRGGARPALWRERSTARAEPPPTRTPMT